MGRLSALTSILFAAVALGQGAKDDDLGSAFGPPPPPKAFVSERNIPAPPLPEDPNAKLRVTYEKDLATAQKAFDGGGAAAAREQLALVELSAFVLGGPERVRVHKLQRAVAVKLDDKKGIREADEKWLAACGPNEVPACRAGVLEAIAAYDKPRADKVRAADACLTAAEQGPGRAPPGCLDGAQALYQKAEDTLMAGRAELVRALALAADPRQRPAAKKVLAKLASQVDDRSAPVKRGALEAQSRLELAEGAVEDAARDALLAAEAYATTLPPAQRFWARTPAVDVACAAYEKVKGVGSCRPLEKRVVGDYLFHDFSVEHLGERELISHEKLVAVNEHYGVLIKNCLAAEIRSIDDRSAAMYRVKWLVINNGHVDNFHSESSEDEQSRFVQCLREQFGYWRYPSHSGDPQRIEQTFSVKSSTRTTEEAEPE